MAEAPRRIQLRRAKGWRMPPGTVKVDRSTRRGNPFTLAKAIESGYATAATAQAFVVERFRDWLGPSQSGRDWWQGPESDQRKRVLVGEIAGLRGKNLACWCKLCEAHRDGKPFGVACQDCAPCHSDPLGEIANASDGEGYGSPRPTLNADEGPGTNPQPDKSREGT